MMEKQGRKRSRPSGGGSGGDQKLSKRQQKNMAAKTPYFTPKPTTSAIQRKLDDIPMEEWMPQQRIDLIADLSESILEDPSSALTSSRIELPSSGKTSKSKKKDDDDDDDVESSKKEPQYQKTQSKVNKLLDLASLSHNGYDAHAARLALLSLLAIFQDILPSYRIRLPTEAEMNVRVSKDVKATWDYERRLLQAYQRYLQLLEKTWEDGKFGRIWSDGGKKGKKSQGGGPPTTLAATAILSLSALLQTCYNFNFRTNLLQIVVRQANHRSSEEVRSACCNALSTMFAKDAKGDASLEAVRFMAKMIKQQSTSNTNKNNSSKSNINPALLNTWLSLPLRVHEDEAAAAKLASAAKAKRAKKSQQDKEAQDIERDMKEGDATVDKMELAKNQADCLHAVTLTYFRILKLVANDDGLIQAESVGNDGRGNSNKKAGSTNGTALELLPYALRGLAKFSHLIHSDAVVDLLEVLKDLLKSDVVSNLPPDAAIHCILCALRTLKGPGRETVLPVDPKEYLIPLYNLLPRLGVAKIGSENNSEAALVQGSSDMDKIIEASIQCLDHALLQRRELSTTRLSAFLKRIASTSLHCPPHSATPLLATARQISARYRSSKVERMLENEEDIVAEGMFAPDAEDPEHANAHATSLWELALLRYSIHPKVAEQAAGMAEGRLLKLPGEAPVKIWASMGRNAREAYIPQKAVWKKHPLDNRVLVDDGPAAGADGGDSRRKGLYDAAAAEGVSRKKRRQQRRNQNQVRFITPRRTGNWHLLPATSYSML
mmetsp:Transcript_16572/g.29905  ORF Transcript_16572/g.29905 Transcript_16572/m.29905 type:complete len:775 (+) Transcript_16572:149-2473(+)|eukprot:CAMPEP_0196145320 /NCGR_PEP_ID=MMETSP0910-20130528/19914_1 /TAXON_ID=49265 /ORGANISM="Thalassiosira rotula, Strain GSO102" /LENGTH=774 /DNA_ID=CAMNT_0041407243 /DNA_START=57 /DNA_END=2381 /DNA_ORIENTATION=-